MKNHEKGEVYSTLSSVNGIEKERSTHVTTMQQPAVGVFEENTQAEQAINELYQAGFDHSQIRFAGHGMPSGVLEKIKSLLSGEDISVGGIYENLVKMGVSPEDARYYQNEFEAGRTIVVVQGMEDLRGATTTLTSFGGYNVNQLYAQSAAHGRGVGAQAPSTKDVNEEENRHPF